MKPCAFEYFNPQSVQEAIELLDRYGDEAKIIAGGQSLVPMMNFRLARPEILIDISAIKELEYIKTEGDELVIGALARERDIEQSPLVLEKWPFLSKAISFIGHSAIRNRGTIGGSLVHADPSAEIPTSLCALNGKVKVVGPSGEKILQPEEFFLTYLTTSLEPSDLLVEVRIPALPEKTGWSFGELSRRSGDFAIVAVGILLFTETPGVCREARISMGGVASTPVRAEEAEALLAGQKITEKLIAAAAQQAAEETDTEPDYHASAEYRMDMARVFVKRGLQEACNMINGGQ
jgi:carbon-monoxide dehydrogenase medium subunit/2-furoyl-CoA dehydrogenase FAD binding subunit